MLHKPKSIIFHKTGVHKLSGNNTENYDIKLETMKTLKKLNEETPLKSNQQPQCNCCKFLFPSKLQHGLTWVFYVNVTRTTNLIVQLQNVARLQKRSSGKP